MLTAITIKSRFADASASFLVARGCFYCSRLLGALAGDALGEIEETVGTLVAHWTSVVFLAFADSGFLIWSALSGCFLSRFSSRVMAWARIALREVHESFGTRVA